MKTSARSFGLALLTLGLLLGAGAASAQIKINEIRVDQNGNDTDEYFELIGAPGASLAGLSYIVIGDTGSASTCGVIESIANLGPYSLQADGLLCLRNSNSLGTPVLSGYDGAEPMAFENSDNVTHLVVSGFTGNLFDDLDANDDGVLDVTPWTSVVDCLGLDKGTAPDCATEEYLYCGTRIGPHDAFVPPVVPRHVYRRGDTQAWAIGIRDTLPSGTFDDTPGAPNTAPLFADMTRDPCVPLIGQPATVVAVVRKNPTSAELWYRVNGGAENMLAMEVAGTVDDIVYFFAQIPAQAGNETLVEYYCEAHNPETSRSVLQGYFVGTEDIADLRVNDANGNNVYRFYGARVRGHVTAAYDVFSGANTDYYVQDATGGLNVFQFGPHAAQPALGDNITVVGSLDQFNGKLELSVGGSCDAMLVTIHGPGTPPAPLAVNACDIGEAHEGLLVRVEDMVINTRGHTVFFADSSYRVWNCYFDLSELRIDGDTDIGGNPITTSHLEVVGIAGQFDTSTPYTTWYQVLPRAMADITFLSMTSVRTPEATGDARLWPCAPSPFSRTAEIRYQVPASGTNDGAVPARLAVFDLRGRGVATLVDGPVVPGVHIATLDRAVLDAGNGVYFYRLEVGGRAITRKLVMLGP